MDSQNDITMYIEGYPYINWIGEIGMVSLIFFIGDASANTFKDCINTAKLKKTHILKDVTIENNNQTVTFDTDNEKFLYEPKISNKPIINCVIQHNYELTGNELLAFCENGNLIQEPLPISALTQMAPNLITNNNTITIPSTIFSFLGDYYCDNVLLINITNGEVILIQSTNNITYDDSQLDLKAPYYFKDNGTHTVDFDFIGFVPEFYSFSDEGGFYGSCATYFSEDAFDGVYGTLRLGNCDYLKELTIPKELTSIVFSKKSIEKINVKHGSTLKIINDSFLFNSETKECECYFGKQSVVKIPDIIKRFLKDALTDFARNNITELILPNSVDYLEINIPNLKKLTIFNVERELREINAPILELCTINGQIGQIYRSFKNIFNCGTDLIFSGNSISDDGKCLINGDELLMFLDNVSTSYEVPKSITKINAHSFSDFDNLATIILGEQINTIYGDAFFSCDNLSTIYCKNVTAPYIYSNTFQGVKRLGKLYVPKDSDYSSWLKSNSYYLGYYNWTIEYI